MPLQFASFISELRSLLQDNGSVQGDATLESVRRFRIFAGTGIVVNLAYIAAFRLGVVGNGSEQSIRWVEAIVTIHGIMALSMLLLGLIAHRMCLRNQRGDPQAFALQIVFSGFCLAIGVAFSVADQIVSPNTTNFATLCLLLAMLSLMRPAVTLLMYALTYLVFYHALALTQTDPELLAMARSHGFSAVVLSVIASVVVWRQYAAAMLLRREIVHGNLELAKKQTELEFLATHDTLTGLYNRREFMRQAEMEMVRSSRFPSDTCKLMVDLDFFKKINDQYGHPAGDSVLRQIGNILKLGVRATDVVARMGGEEFIVLLPSTDQEGALAVAEKLRCAIREKPLQVQGHALLITASIGVSGAERSQRASVEGLYAGADQALYVAKQSGRDRVEYLAFEPVGASGDIAR